mgnify:CR=1 FL=1
MYKIIVKNFTKNRPIRTAFEVTQNLNEFIPQLGDKIYLIDPKGGVEPPTSSQ